MRTFTAKLDLRRGVAPRTNTFVEVLLRDEDEGIFAWIVEDTIRHSEELDRVGDFALSAAQTVRIDDLLHESGSPEIFVAGYIVKQKDADLAVDELTNVCLDSCRARGWESFRTHQFENELLDLMEQYHGARRRNDIVRAGKSARAFKHVTLKGKNAK